MSNEEEFENLRKSKEAVGEILPVIKDQHGNILDGVHRKKIDPNWKETVVEVPDVLTSLRIRVHSNIVRRDVTPKEKHSWIMEVRQLMNRENPMQPSQEEVGKVLGMSREWVRDYETLANLANVDLKVFNIWNFQKCEDDFGDQRFKGRIPGQIVQNILYFFLENPNGKIIDPMAGGGTTYDVIEKWWNNELGYDAKCLSYDLAPKRDFIKPRDILLPIADEAKNADLIFLDPPYFDMKFEQFPDINSFYSWLEKVAENCYDGLKLHGKVCILMADNTKHEFVFLRGKTYEIFKQKFGEPIAVISVPMTTEQANEKEILNAKDSRKLLGRDRTLFVFKKESS